MKYVALLLLAFFQILISLFLVIKIRSRVGRQMLAFTTVLFIWTITNALLDYTYSMPTSISITGLSFINKIGFVTGVGSIVLLYRLMLIFPVQREKSKSQTVITVFGICLTIASFFPIISGTISYSSTGSLTYTYGSLTLLITAYFLVTIIATARGVFESLRNEKDVFKKRQTRTILISLLFTGIVALVFILVLPILTDNDSYTFAGYFAPFIFTLAIAYSIIRLKFLNFKIFALRSVAYLLAIASVVMVFSAFTIFATSSLFDTRMALSQEILLGVMCAVAAILFQPIKIYFDKITNTLFYRDAYDPQIVIDKVNVALIDSTDLEKLMRTISGIIENHIKISFVDIYLSQSVVSDYRAASMGYQTTRDWSELAKKISPADGTVVVYDEEGPETIKNVLQSMGVEVVLGLSTSSQQLGLLIIGARKSGNAYTDEDIRLFGIIAKGVSVAIQNALSFEEISQFNMTLQKKIQEATKDLQRTNDKLKALDEAKDDFISMASHQLRTPLTSIKGYLSMVLDGDAGEIKNGTQRKMIEQAYTSSQRMTFLIADLLNLSRLKTGKFIIEAAPTNLAPLIGQELSQVRATADARNITLSYAEPQDFPVLNIDETKTRQVIMNFIDNAIYYTGNDGKIIIKLEEKERAIECTVTDDGIGIPKKEQHSLFTKFFRATNAKKVRPDGTGLGLYMAHKVIAAQGGAIIFHSEEGKGSTFGFTIPKQTGNNAPDNKTALTKQT